VASPSTASVYVIIQDGFFGARVGQVLRPAPATRDLTVIDFDRDGWPDLAPANTTSAPSQPAVSVFRNLQGTLQYAASATSGLASALPAGDRRGIAMISIDGDG
jgi:hypothetical protein